LTVTAQHDRPVKKRIDYACRIRASADKIAKKPGLVDRESPDVLQC
jgi:hypothetical protein